MVITKTYEATGFNTKRLYLHTYRVIGIRGLIGFMAINHF
jgi:hypothetical protein